MRQSFPEAEKSKQIRNSYFPDIELHTVIHELIQISFLGVENINIVKGFEPELLLNRLTTIESILTLANTETSMRIARIIGFKGDRLQLGCL